LQEQEARNELVEGQLEKIKTRITRLGIKPEKNGKPAKKVDWPKVGKTAMVTVENTAKVAGTLVTILTLIAAIKDMKKK
jgi:hypothetical protein